MERRMIAVQEHVPAGETVWNGYVGGETHCTAPDEPGVYTLYELADEYNCHAGWQWVKEEEDSK